VNFNIFNSLGSAAHSFYCILELFRTKCQRPALIALSTIVSVAALPIAGQAADVYINVGEANFKKSLMALPECKYLGAAEKPSSAKSISLDLSSTLLNDLDSTGYFQFVKQDAYLEDPEKVGLKPAPGESNGFKYENWSKIGTEFLIRCGFSVIKGQITLKAFLYDVKKAKSIVAKEYSGPEDKVRKVAHTFANDVVEGLTGKPGYFLTRIVVGSDRGGNSWKEIYIMDWDAKNPKQITRHKSIALSPNWSPEGKKVAYTAYVVHTKSKKRNADLFTYEIFTGKRELISSRPGINSGAAFSPDGKHIFMTISQAGSPDIFRVGSSGDGLKQITKGPAGAMYVEPAVSPDGKKIAFSSDRSGKPMVYTMDIDGTNMKRITFAGKYNASPSWSPDGKKIAFAGFDKDHFDVFVMNADGTNMVRLTTEKKINGKMSNNEDPAFSPDGRQVMFVSDRTKNKQIYLINADGTNERRLTVDKHNYFKPKWSWVND